MRLWHRSLDLQTLKDWSSKSSLEDGNPNDDFQPLSFRKNRPSSHLQRPQYRQLLGGELFGHLGQVGEVLGFCFKCLAILEHALPLSCEDGPDELRPILGVFLALITGEKKKIGAARRRPQKFLYGKRHFKRR
jgi:hypothetical protein